MKKLSKIFICLCLICILSALFVACKSSSDNDSEIISQPVGDLSAEQVTQIRKDFLEYYTEAEAAYTHHRYEFDINTIEVLKYLGTYSGNIAIEILNDNYDRDMDDTRFIVDGVEIGSWGANNEFWLYIKEQKIKFITFQSAFDSGYLSHEDLVSIADYYAKA